jgi:hypothetical protein
MVILRATSILGGQNEDKGMMCSITLEIKKNEKKRREEEEEEESTR